MTDPNIKILDPAVQNTHREPAQALTSKTSANMHTPTTTVPYTLGAALDCIIEIPANGVVKYELDKVANCPRVDRFLNVAMHYPANYGFIPNTLSKDGDPLDALVITQTPIIPGCVISVRPVAVFLMEDDAGQDEKLICYPAEKVDPYYSKIIDLDHIEAMLRDRINHFFERYKDLERGKWVKIVGFRDAASAHQVILEAYALYNQNRQIRP